MGFVLTFLPAILSVIVILMSLPWGVTRIQLVLSVFAFSGLVLLVSKYMDGYRAMNLPFIGAAIVFAGSGLYRRFHGKE